MTQLNFLNIGAAKCGTTTLHDILIQHPELCIPVEKDFHYFDNEANYRKGATWYESYFKTCEKATKRGEISATYLYSEAAAARLANDVGNELKIIVLLRNPAHRAFSEYLHQKRTRLEFDFDFNAHFESHLKIDSSMPLYETIIGRGFYFKHLKVYADIFGKANLKIGFLEDLNENPSVFIDEILEFIGADRQVELDLNVLSNIKFIPRNKRFHVLFYSNKNNVLRRTLKFLVPSFEKREAIRNYFKKFNKGKGRVEQVQSELYQYLMHTTYAEDISMLEGFLGKKINSW